MQVYHFYQLLPTLSKSEVRGFRSFLKKQGAVGERLLPLFDYVKQFLPKLDQEKRLDPTAIFFHFFPDHKQDNRKLILNQLSDLHNLLMEFLSWQQLDQIPYLGDYIRLQVLQERGLKDAYHRKAKQLSRKLESHTAAGSWELLFRAKLYEDIIQNTGEKFTVMAAILKKLRSVLDEGYLAGRYKFAAAWVKFQQFLPGKESDLEPDLPLVHGPLAEAYRRCYQLEQYEKEADFLALRQMVLDQKITRIPPEDQYELLTSLVNFTAAQIRNRKMDYLQEAFQLYQYGLEHKILLQGRGLTTGKFSNIVSLGCSLQEFNWTLDFIQRYQQHLPMEDSRPLAVLSQANVSMEKKAFQECLDILRNFTFFHPNYSLKARLLELRAMYDLPDRDEEDILQAGRNFRRFLQTNRSVKGDNKKSALHFLSMIRALVRRKKSRDHLHQKFQELNPVFHQKWLKDKLASYTRR